MPIKKRLINCDYFNTSGFTSLSNKAKLLYFYFLTNADDKGFVGNGRTIANTLDQCEEKYDNVLFNYRYIDSIQELIDKGFVYEFCDKHNNKTFLIRHWFKHNKPRNGLTTLFVSYLAKVELVDGEYQLKTIKGENLKEKEIKVNENKVNKNHYDNKKDLLDSDNIRVEKEKEKDWEKQWDNFLDDINKIPGEKET